MMKRHPIELSVMGLLLGLFALGVVGKQSVSSRGYQDTDAAIHVTIPTASSQKIHLSQAMKEALKGRVLRQEGHHRQALTFLNRALTLHESAPTPAEGLPEREHGMTLLNRGLAHLATRQWDAAKHDLDRAIALFRTLPSEAAPLAEAYTSRAIIHRQRRQREATLNDLSQAIAIQQSLSTHADKPSIPSALAQNHVQRALIWRMSNQLARALADYEEAARLQRTLIATDDPRGQSALATILSSQAWLLAAGADPSLWDGDQAKEKAEEACALTNWQNDEALIALAAAYARLGDFTQATTWLTKAIPLSPEHRKAPLAEILQAYQKGQTYQDP